MLITTSDYIAAISIFPLPVSLCDVLIGFNEFLDPQTCNWVAVEMCFPSVTKPETVERAGVILRPSLLTIVRCKITLAQ